MTRRTAGISLILGAVFLRGCRFLADGIISTHGGWVNTAHQVDVVELLVGLVGVAYLIVAEKAVKQGQETDTPT